MGVLTPTPPVRTPLPSWICWPDESETGFRQQQLNVDRSSSSRLLFQTSSEEAIHARSHGGAFGDSAPSNFLCPPKFCCTQKNLF